MPLILLERPVAASMRRVALYAALIAVGAVGSLAVTRLTRDPHTAVAERLAGTVTWSNAEQRMFAFEADGEVRDPLAGDVIYHVLGSWEDVGGTWHGADRIPDCLAGRDGDPASMERRRVELDVIRRSVGGAQKANVAVHIRCRS